MTEDVRVTVERVLRETGVDTRVEPPSWTDWMSDVGAAVARSLFGRLEDLPTLPALTAPLIVWGVIALLAVTSGLLAVRALSARRARRRGSGAPSVDTPADAPEARLAPAEWKRRAQERLAAGDARGTLEAAWWWFATFAAADSVDASWTTRDVVRRSQRSDLAGVGMALDRALYAAGGRDGASLARLLGQLSETLA